MLQIKQLSKELWTILLGLTSVWIIKFVVEKEQEVFRHSLFVRKSLVTVYELVSYQMVRKLTLGIILCVLGVCCIALYHLVFGNNTFLQLACCYFLAAGIISTIWDLNTLFYISQPDSRLWQHCADSFCILFVAEIYLCILQYLTIGKPRRIFTLFLETITVFCFICAWVCPPLTSLAFIKIYGTVLLFFTMILLIFMIRDRGTAWTLKNIWMLLFADYMILLIGYHKIDSLAKFHTHYLNRFPYILTFFCIVLFCKEFREYRMNVFYNQDINRKIREANEFKDSILNRIMHYCLDSLNRNASLNKLLLEDKDMELTNRQKQIVTNMKHENEQMKDFLQNLRRYHMMMGHSVHLAKIEIGFNLILQSALDALKQEDCMWDDETNCHISQEDGIIYGDPYQIIRLHMDFLKLLWELKEDGKIEIATAKKERSMEVHMNIHVREESIKRIRHVSKFLNSKYPISHVESVEDTPTVIAKNILLLHGGKARALMQKNLFLLSYQLPLYTPTEKILPEEPASAFSGESSNRKTIVLITTSLEQENLIASYLSYEPYILKIFRDGEEALGYIRMTMGIGLVIIGNAFIHRNVRQICEDLRKEFSMVQLPILLIQRKDYENMEQGLWSYVNDIMDEPYGKEKLLSKIQRAILLQQSAEDTIKAKLEFWQSQMNPHFIFNSISAIMPLCLEAPEKAYQLLGDFGDYLRGNLFGGELKENAIIKREINLIQSYLELEKVRFGEKIQYEMNVQCDEEAKILPLLIEPIVENCVKHGKKLDRPIHIWIDLFQSDGWVYIQVKDDGKGITPERLNEVLEMVDAHSVGLSNIRRRLMIYYHEELNIQSIPQEETIVSFKIPVKK